MACGITRRPGAFVETLFAKHHGEIYAYLLRMLREPELAADLTQDAFIKAYKNYETLEKPENARAWLYQIAHRVALDEIRRRKIIRFFPWTGESPGSAPSAERLVMDAHLSGDMQRALARIPERQRAALLLAELHDLTGVELAAALGVSHVAARALLTRARESLRQALAAERGGGGGGRSEPGRARTPRSAIDEPRPSHPPPTRERFRRPTTSAPAVSPPSGSTHRSKQRIGVWLDEHLAGCDACRAIAAAYDADRAALRGLRDHQPEPPRDLWARTSAAIEREVGRSRWGRAADIETGGAARDPRSASCPAWPSSPSSSAPRSCRAGTSMAPTTADRAAGEPAAGRHRELRPRRLGRRRSRSGRARSAGSAPRPTARSPTTSPSVDEVCPQDRQPDCAPVCRWQLPAGRAGHPAEVDLSIADRERGGRRRHGFDR